VHDIVTLTMNPALDIATATPQVRPDHKLRCASLRTDPGGGGVNVARIAHALGASVLAVIPTGGPTGQVVRTLLAGEGVPCEVVPIRGSTRECITVAETDTARQYRFVLPGPTLTRNEQSSCLDAIERLSAAARFVVASGSLPPGVPTDFYQRVSTVVQGSEARFVLDSSGEALRQVHSGVFLRKPSIRELRDLTGRPLETPSDQVRAARELIESGVCARVVVSLGSRGALAVTPDRQYAIPALPKEVRSGVGAGDSLVAGTVVGLCRGSSFGEAVRLGVAASAAMLMTPGTAACTRDQVEQCRSELHGIEGTSGATDNGGELVRETKTRYAGDLAGRESTPGS
jgi:6-phosphofructokinase 2